MTNDLTFDFFSDYTEPTNSSPIANPKAKSTLTRWDRASRSWLSSGTFMLLFLLLHAQMPQIVVQSTPGRAGNEELFLLEFQGKFETSLAGEGDGSLSGQRVGQLQWEGEKPVFLVGNQRLFGRQVNLPKPLAILKQSRGEKEITVECVIRKKILFDSRPITVMK